MLLPAKKQPAQQSNPQRSLRAKRGNTPLPSLRGGKADAAIQSPLSRIIQ